MEGKMAEIRMRDPEQPVPVVLPQVMTFDHNGVKHRIFMDVGTHDEAYSLAADGNWEALSKWPEYTGQVHDYESYNKIHGTSYGQPAQVEKQSTDLEQEHRHDEGV